jgi:hypothetical protein
VVAVGGGAVAVGGGAVAVGGGAVAVGGGAVAVGVATITVGGVVGGAPASVIAPFTPVRVTGLPAKSPALILASCTT